MRRLKTTTISPRSPRMRRRLRPQRGTRSGIAPKDVALQARLMCASLPLMTSALVQQLASWASFVPPLRRAAYEIAGMAFMRRHVCRMADFPLGLCHDYLARNQHVYETMWGPSEFFATGVLADWNVEPRLGEMTCRRSCYPAAMTRRHRHSNSACKTASPDRGGQSWSTARISRSWRSPSRYREVLTSFLDDVGASDDPRPPRAHRRGARPAPRRYRHATRSSDATDSNGQVRSHWLDDRTVA